MIFRLKVSLFGGVQKTAKIGCPYSKSPLIVNYRKHGLPCVNKIQVGRLDSALQRNDLLPILFE